MATIDIGDVVAKALKTLLPEILELKRSYFSVEGKPGWKPLEPATIKKKASSKPKNKLGWTVPPQNALVFNVEFGFLKNSLQVFAEVEGNKIIITVEASHRNGDEALETLISTYGRDFLHFDDKEINWIKKRLIELINDNIY